MASRPTHAADSQHVLELARALEAARAEVMVSGDPEQSAELFAPELAYIHSSGSIDTRDELLAKYRRKFYVYRTSSLDVADAKAFSEDLVWLRGKMRLDVRVGEVEKVVEAIYAAIWTRRDGRWRLAVHQSTGVPAPAT